MDELAHTGRAHREQDHARGEGGHEQAAEAEADRDRGEDHDEGGRRAGDLDR
jgi:hypothetical protein